MSVRVHIAHNQDISADQFYLSAILPYLTNIIIFLNVNNQIVEFNAAAEQFYQYKKHEILGINFIEFCKKNNFDCFLPENLQSIKYNAQEYLQSITFETGENHIALWKIVPCYNDSDKTQGLILIGTDVTREKIAEKGVANIERRLESVVESIAGNHWWKDMNGRYMGCNDTVAKSLGFNSGLDIIGKTDYDLPWADAADELIKNDQEVMQSGVSQRKEETVISKEGKKLTFLVTKVPLKNENGNVIGTIGTSVDITDQKAAQAQLKIAKEKAESANQAKAEFIANMSHDLRTPLSGILGMSELLEKRISGKYREMAHEIVQASKILSDLLTDIIEHIRFETNTSPLRHDRFEIRVIIQSIVDLMLPSAKHKKLKLKSHIDKSIPQYIVGDVVRTHRILLNLISNAIKFTKKGYVAIDIKLTHQQGKEIILKITIEDTGIGIPENKLDQIFSRFTRLTHAYEGTFKGAGLGLSIVKQFIKELNGEISVESKLNKGSKFVCILPFKKISHNKKILQSGNKKSVISVKKQKLQSSSVGTGPVILLIEDDLLSQKVAKFNLENFNCTVDVAGSGKKALAMFKKRNYDLVLMDIGLPDMNACKIAETIRKKGKKRIPIIALTAHIDGQKKEVYIQSGMDEILTKPLLAESTKNILKKYLNKRV